MNDTDATQAQVSDTLKDMVEGIVPLAVITLGCLILTAMAGDSDDATQ